jgi:hypothetical protein
MDTTTLPEHLQGLVGQELQPGEEIRWLGQPQRNARIPRLGLFVLFIAVPWVVLVPIFIAFASGLVDPVHGVRSFDQLNIERVVFALFVSPLFFIGLVLLVSPLWLRPLNRQAADRTAYVITNQRVLILDGGFAGDGAPEVLAVLLYRSLGKQIVTSSWQPNELGQIERVQRRNGLGDVLCKNGPITVAGFYSIPNVDEVAAILETLVNAGTVDLIPRTAGDKDKLSREAQHDQTDTWMYKLFLGVGVGVLLLVFFTMILPEWRANQVYVEGRCLVIDKRAGRSSSKSGFSYRPEIQIRYTVNGHDFDAWTYDATGSYLGELSRTEAILAQFDVGQHYPCWYDEDDPSAVVLVRGYSLTPFIVLVVPLAFILFSLNGLYRTWKKRSGDRTTNPPEQTEAFNDTPL